jgi:hypothetical protein
VNLAATGIEVDSPTMGSGSGRSVSGGVILPTRPIDASFQELLLVGSFLPSNHFLIYLMARSLSHRIGSLRSVGGPSDFLTVSDLGVSIV